jgi:hypothetical protein
MKILICGDSFAADWQVKYPKEKGWPNLVAEDHIMTNLAQAGCSEYKIYQQLNSVNLNDFDKILISHTSPYRVYIKHHPVHSNDLLHSNSDLIYTDLKEHAKTDKSLASIIDYFEKYFDLDHAIFVHNLICRQIDEMTNNYDVTHLSNLDWSGLYQFLNMLNFEYLFKNRRGSMNHYDQMGNLEIYNKLKSVL